MNIFYVDKDPAKAAQSLVDKHVVKMCLETTQLLCTAHRVLDGFETPENKYTLIDMRDKLFYKPTHINHPCSVWVRESVSNYNWTVEHLYGLLNEYSFRYDKRHKCYDLFLDLQSPPHNLKEWDWTEPPNCMEKKYIISENVLDNYRNYYIIGKKELHSWKNRDVPEWINENKN